MPSVSPQDVERLVIMAASRGLDGKDPEALRRFVLWESNHPNDADKIISTIIERLSSRSARLERAEA